MLRLLHVKRTFLQRMPRLRRISLWIQSLFRGLGSASPFDQAVRRGSRLGEQSRSNLAFAIACKIVGLSDEGNSKAHFR
jgi:hypothetical protein